MESRKRKSSASGPADQHVDDGHSKKKRRVTWTGFEPCTPSVHVDRRACSAPAAVQVDIKTPEDELESTYSIGDLVEEGGMASVYAGTRISDGMPVALKYAAKKESTRELDIPGLGGPLIAEVALMKLVTAEPSSPYIIKLLDWFDLGTHYVMVLERPEPCQDLDIYAEENGGVLEEPIVQDILRQLLQALRHCRDRGVLHRDVKPENILVQTDTLEIKLIDFGCGDLLKDDSYDYYSGTRLYAPPEWFLENQYLAWPATAWSVGVTLYRLVCGNVPFSNCRELTEVRLTFPEEVSFFCKDIIRWCLNRNPAHRPSLEQIEDCLWLHNSQPR